jgi:hypothetical protein
VAWCRKAPGRSVGLSARADKATRPALKAQGQGRGTPQEGTAQESQGAVAAEKSESGDPNRQRDETPEAKPLSAALPHAPKARQASLIREGPDFRVRAEESIPADDQSRGDANAVGFMSD